MNKIRRPLIIIIVFAMLAATITPTLLILTNSGEPASAATTGTLKIFDGTATRDKNWATAFKDSGGTAIDPLKFKSMSGTDITRQSVDIAMILEYNDTSKGSNTNGEWREESTYIFQNANDAGGVSVNINGRGFNNDIGTGAKSVQIPKLKVDGRDASVPAAGTFDGYTNSILTAYKALSGDILTKHTVTYTFTPPKEVLDALKAGKDVYVYAENRGFMEDHPAAISKVEFDQSSKTVSVTTSFNPAAGYEGTTRSVANTLWSSGYPASQNYCPINSYMTHFKVYKNNPVGRLTYGAAGVPDKITPPGPSRGIYGSVDYFNWSSMVNGTDISFGKTIKQGGDDYGETYLYSTGVQVHTDYPTAVTYFITSYSNSGGGTGDTNPPLKFTISATPKEHEVAAPVGLLGTLGTDATITVDLTQDKQSLADWTKRLTFVDTVDVYMTLTSPDGRVLTCPTKNMSCFNNPTGSKVTLTKAEFLTLLKSKLSFVDKVASKTIASNQRIQYDYTFSMKVTFKENGTGGEVTVTAASSKKSDYASFFRVKDPPNLEYVKYISNPAAYSELKQGTIGNETFEAMAGTPTTRDLYFAVGGSEFIVDFEGIIQKNQTTERTYHVHYDGCACEFKKGDTAVMGGQDHSFSENRDNWSAVWTAHGAKPDHPAANPKTYTWTAASDKQARTVTESASWIDTSVSWISDTDGTASGYWQYTVPAHAICGPCCQHDLPAVDDTWTQEITYDYLDFEKAVVWRLEQGKLTGMSVITGSDTINAAILQGLPNIFCNIAATEDSRGGRLRYSVEPQQHDEVTWNKGARTNKCDKQTESWGTGIKYTNSGYPHNGTYLENVSTAKDKASVEYAEFKRNRETNVTATVISDFLILQTSSGDQSVVYYDKKTNTVQTQQDYAPVPLTKAECWDSNPKSAANWTPVDINIGSYNGKYSDTSNKYTGNGGGSRVTTVFDSDPANTIIRPSRPTQPLYVAKYNINIVDTLSNGQYLTGSATAAWKTLLNYNPDSMQTPYTMPDYTIDAPYSKEHSKINDIIIHDPISSEYAMVLPLDSSRDQRVDSDKGVWRALAASQLEVCPCDAANCEFRELNCKYIGTTYHIASCYTEADYTYPNNSHYHSISCIDMAKVAQALTPVTVATYTCGNLPLNSGWVDGGYTCGNLPLNDGWVAGYYTCNNQPLNDGYYYYDFSDCNDCRYGWYEYLTKCPHCGSTNMNHTSGSGGPSYHTHTASCGYVAGYYSTHTHTGVCGQSAGYYTTHVHTAACVAQVPTGEYTGTSWGLVDLAEAALNGVTDSWLAKQPSSALAHITKCGNLPLNIHTCNASCSHTPVLICNEPHHEGGHYDVDSELGWACWDACCDDTNHQHKSTGMGDAAGLSAGNFVNLDWGFQVYYPNLGDFYQGGAYGIPSLTTQRGKGFVDGMDTTEWLKSKRIKFDFDVIYCGPSSTLNINGSQHGNASDGSDNHKHTASCKAYHAGEWIELDKNYEYYNFYCPLSNTEQAGTSVCFESVAVNAPDGVDNALPTNRLRDSVFSARHSATKNSYIDVVGRVGNLVLSDTGDWRFSNFFKNPIEPTEWQTGYENLVKKVDITSKNYVLTEKNDIRGLLLGGFGQDTYGLSAWLRDKLIPFSLSPEKNNIKTLQKEPIRAGYPMYMSVDTMGRDITKLTIIPYYYWYDTVTHTAEPLDVYTGNYKAVNLFGRTSAASGFNLELKWQSEYKRRNVSDAEWERTKGLSAIYPSGDYLKQGTAQMITLDERSRTYISSSQTLGKNQNLGGLSAVLFDTAVKRWQFTLGLPSSAFFVDAGADPFVEANREKYEQRSGCVLMTAEIYAYGDNGFTLEHSLSGDGTFTVGGMTYAVPEGLPPVVAVIHGTLSSRDDWTVIRTH